jgi:hypothetical protein
MRRQIAGEHVIVEWHKRDRWKRLSGIVRLAGELNPLMIDRGLAWQYKQYADEQRPVDRKTYASAEIAAQDARGTNGLMPQLSLQAAVSELQQSLHPSWTVSECFSGSTRRRIFDSI